MRGLRRARRTRSQALAREGATGRPSLPAFVAGARAAARGVAHGAGRRWWTRRSDLARALLERGRRRSSTAATRTTTTTSAAPASCGARGLHYVDVGTSGGVWGLERGFCLMIGGEAAVVKRLDPIFAALAPGVGARAAHPGPREGRRHRRARLPPLRPERGRPLREDGPQRHRVRADGGLRRGAQHPAPRQRRARQQRDARRRDHAAARTRSTTATTSTCATSPRSGGAAAWSPRGCSTSPRSALTKSRDLDGFSGRVSDSGEGRWTIAAAIDEGVPAPVLSSGALRAVQLARRRPSSRTKVLSAMRFEFGGHQEKPAEDGPKGA